MNLEMNSLNKSRKSTVRGGVAGITTTTQDLTESLKKPQKQLNREETTYRAGQSTYLDNSSVLKTRDQDQTFRSMHLVDLDMMLDQTDEGKAAFSKAEKNLIRERMKNQALLKDIMRREELEHQRRERQLEKITEENAKKKDLYGMNNYEEKMAIQGKAKQEIRLMAENAEERARQERLMNALINGNQAVDVKGQAAIELAKQQFEILKKAKQDKIDYQNAKLKTIKKPVAN